MIKRKKAVSANYYYAFEILKFRFIEKDSDVLSKRRFRQSLERKHFMGALKNRTSYNKI